MRLRGSGPAVLITAWLCVGAASAAPKLLVVTPRLLEAAPGVQVEPSAQERGDTSYAMYQLTSTLEGRSPLPVMRRSRPSRFRPVAVGLREGADYVASGVVQVVEDGWRVSLFVDETSSGKRLAAEELHFERFPGGREGPANAQEEARFDRVVVEAADRLFGSLQPEPLECRMPEVRQPYTGWMTSPPAFPSAEEVCGLVRDYYRTKGEWAGQFEIETMTTMREQAKGPLEHELHVRYRYRCVAKSCESSLQTGYDQRVFEFRVVGGNWTVVGMGAYLSASP